MTSRDAQTDERTMGHLLEEQAALRRVATLVASAATPEQVFQSVAEEAGRLLGARTSATVRFDARRQSSSAAGTTAKAAASRSEPPSPTPNRTGRPPTRLRRRPHRRVRRCTGRSGQDDARRRLSVFCRRADHRSRAHLGRTLRRVRGSAVRCRCGAALARLREARRARARKRGGPRSVDCLPRAHRRSKRHTSGSDSSATSTTAPNNASSPWPSSCASPRNACTKTRPRRRQCSPTSARS